MLIGKGYTSNTFALKGAVLVLDNGARIPISELVIARPYSEAVVGGMLRQLEDRSRPIEYRVTTADDAAIDQPPSRELLRYLDVQATKGGIYQEATGSDQSSRIEQLEAAIIPVLQAYRRPELYSVLEAALDNLEKALGDPPARKEAEAEIEIKVPNTPGEIFAELIEGQKKARLDRLLRDIKNLRDRGLLKL